MHRRDQPVGILKGPPTGNNNDLDVNVSELGVMFDVLKLRFLCIFHTIK